MSRNPNREIMLVSMNISSGKLRAAIAEAIAARATEKINRVL
jgi:hypothetical protein